MTTLQLRPDQNYSIQQASELSGLSPSVLRIWETRYGWPCPHRRSNGYRAYSAQLVADLKRAAALLNDGMTISELVVDGEPQWPVEPERLAAQTKALEALLSLPQPSRPAAQQYYRQIVDVLERKSSHSLVALIDRAAWELRPEDELVAVLAPVAVGLAELSSLDRHLPRDHAEALQAVDRRGKQLMQRFPVSGQPLAVVNNDAQVPALATVSTLILRQGKVGAYVCDINALGERESCLVAGRSLPASLSRPQVVGQLSMLPAAGLIDVASLMQNNQQPDELRALLRLAA